MNVLNYLDTDGILLGVRQKNEKSIISSMLDHLIQKNKISKDSKKEILKAIIQREEAGSTAIGNHIAFPHARLNSVKDAIV
ncbi:MAG: PTS sugar transporter subunit IIA, partial [Candidatus Omnitrophota bacterium]